MGKKAKTIWISYFKKWERIFLNLEIISLGDDLIDMKRRPLQPCKLMNYWSLNCDVEKQQESQLYQASLNDKFIITSMSSKIER